jgi:hypothetical protein
MPKPEFFDKNVEVARNFKPMSEADRRSLTESIAAARKVSMATFLQDHADA